MIYGIDLLLIYYIWVDLFLFIYLFSGHGQKSKYKVSAVIRQYIT